MASRNESKFRAYENNQETLYKSPKDGGEVRNEGTFRTREFTISSGTQLRPPVYGIYVMRVVRNECKIR
jgi:hypothetical protein